MVTLVLRTRNPECDMWPPARSMTGLHLQAPTLPDLRG